ncbi:MAG: DNA/RNA nuclease SfsA [Planctomycetota bacterium]
MILPPLIAGRLLRRYKRFLADVELEDGTQITAHTANPGAMTGLATPGSRVLLSHHPHGKRKLPYSWQIVYVGRTPVGVNPALANPLVREALERGVIAELRGYPHLHAEVPVGDSRLDFELSAPGRPRCLVEVKSVTLRDGSAGLFPDAPSERGRRHLHELATLVAAGERAALLFLVQRGDVRRVGPAREVDPAYGVALDEARAAGVEVLAYRAAVEPSRRRIRVVGRLPLLD